MTKRAPNSRWLRMSLRTLLVALTCVAGACAWFTSYVRQRQTAFAELRRAGGEIRMGIGKPSQLERWFGAEAFGKVYSVNLREGKADNALLRHIGVLRELRILDLSKADIDDEGLRSIAELLLQELWLQETNITDASAAILSKMKSLTFLQLNATGLSDVFLERLEPLPNLSKLGLRGTKVTGVGMKYLARHPMLAKLDVYST